jgi:DNA-directed RNA polymerase specialized sigma24 family protein
VSHAALQAFYDSVEALVPEPYRDAALDYGFWWAAERAEPRQARRGAELCGRKARGRVRESLSLDDVAEPAEEPTQLVRIEIVGFLQTVDVDERQLIELRVDGHTDRQIGRELGWPRHRVTQISQRLRGRAEKELR